MVLTDLYSSMVIIQKHQKRERDQVPPAREPSVTKTTSRLSISQFYIQAITGCFDFLFLYSFGSILEELTYLDICTWALSTCYEN